jgi:hypothetical protein
VRLDGAGERDVTVVHRRLYRVRHFVVNAQHRCGVGRDVGAFPGRNTDPARVHGWVPVELLHDGFADTQIFICQGCC